jgi:hypothetical protein
VQVIGNLNLQFTLQVAPYVRGDVNHDLKIDIGDVVYLINYLYKKGPSPLPYSSGDANNDTTVDISDVIYLINYLFKGGSPPQPVIIKKSIVRR